MGMQLHIKSEKESYKSMRIGYFTTVFPYPESFTDSTLNRLYPVGGSEHVAYHLACNIVERGHEVIVFTSSIDSHDQVEETNGIKIYRYGTNFRIEKALISYNLFFKSIKRDVDIVHLHFSTPPGDLAGLFYAMVKRKPLIVTYHGDAPENFGNLIRRVLMYLFNRLFVNSILSTAKFIITPSEYYINQSRFLRKHKSKIVSIPNGINPDEMNIPFTKEECKKKLSFAANDVIILFVGALMESKKPDLLMESLPVIIEKNPNVRLVVAGEGSMRKELGQLANKLGISDKVRFPGSVVGGLKATYFKAADVFAFPSVMEVFPLVLLEASAAGLPMVVSNLCTFQCIIEDGHNGLMTRVDNKKYLAETIIRVLSDPVLREKIRENAKKKVMGYSWENIAKKTEDLYKEALTKGSKN
jgi:glycosyltransferase involved in cell wall biosynthesis